MNVRRSVELPPVLWRAVLLLLGLMVLAFLAEAARGNARADLLGSEFVFQGDLLSFIPRFRDFHSAAFFSHKRVMFMYPAPTAVVYKLAYLLPSPGLFFLVFTAGALLASCLQFSRVLQSRGILFRVAYAFPLCVLLCSYPVWFEVSQGNMEIVVWVLLTVGLGCLLTNRGYAAATCFAVAGSMKIYPLIFFALLLRKRQYRQIAFGVAVLVCTSVVSLWLVCPDLKVSQHGIKDGLATFRTFYMLMIRPEMKDDHSLFALLKMHLHPLPDVFTMSRILTTYLAVAAASGLCLFLFRIRKLPLANQILCLTIAIILLPPTSFEYTLLHLFLPFALLCLVAIEASHTGVAVPGLGWALACMAFVLSFLPELVFHGQHLSGQAKCIGLLGLFGLALLFPFPLTFGAEGSEAHGHRSSASL